MLTETVAVPEPVLRFPIGLIGGILATLGMDLIMGRLPEGSTPPKVAAGVLTDTGGCKFVKIFEPPWGRNSSVSYSHQYESHPDQAPERLAAAAHYLAGAGTGLLYVWLSLATEALAGPPSLLTAAGTGLMLSVLMVGFFVLVPLPRAPGLSSDRRRTTGRDWAIMAAGYLLVLVPVVTVGNQLLA